MGRDALPPRDPSSSGFEPWQQLWSFLINPIGFDAAGSSGDTAGSAHAVGGWLLGGDRDVVVFEDGVALKVAEAWLVGGCLGGILQPGTRRWAGRRRRNCY